MENESIQENGEQPGWTFLSNHAHVLLHIAKEPVVRLRMWQSMWVSPSVRCNGSWPIWRKVVICLELAKAGATTTRCMQIDRFATRSSLTAT